VVVLLLTLCELGAATNTPAKVPPVFLLVLMLSQHEHLQEHGVDFNPFILFCSTNRAFALAANVRAGE